MANPEQRDVDETTEGGDPGEQPVEADAVADETTSADAAGSPDEVTESAATDEAATDAATTDAATDEPAPAAATGASAKSASSAKATASASGATKPPAKTKVVPPKAKAKAKADAATNVRYTPPTPQVRRGPSPRWVPILMFALWGIGLLVIILNYMGVLPGGGEDGSGWYLIAGLVSILGGIMVATQYH